ncbi:hypothetical protein GCM10011613_08050 [Cellvibrio zantedeschiae]|uniref:Solute-binding protein family 3/N-terminal domain-containing protein n=1 Tax=Cellvibrio zantedeschiae TaxID=1237077 RepID=A0ABQ3AUI5_9GAMM|nr:transporter substrate-binding domain-containing protein [Cellvibrio zantedeschiae]GGY66500.1 hypothetical protein GCM10011613_08050 [Cellvibrio zantedeschiae]
MIHYPRADSAADERVNYYSQLLALCLSKTGKDYQLEPTSFHAEQARGLQLVEANRGLEVTWTFTTTAREERLMPIRIPIDRGLFGWRLFLIKKSDQALFDKITTAEQLAALRAGQGHDWPDTEILQANHFLISGSTTYEGLFDMLARNHIQYFPRSLLEVELELKSHPHHNLAMESHLVLHYPTALYFFVNKHNTELAADLEKGLLAAMEDGSFKKLFDYHFSDTIRKADLRKRKIISINNPLLPAQTPLGETRYWFSPQENY